MKSLTFLRVEEKIPKEVAIGLFLGMEAARQ